MKLRTEYVPIEDIDAASIGKTERAVLVSVMSKGDIDFDDAAVFVSRDVFEPGEAKGIVAGTLAAVEAFFNADGEKALLIGNAVIAKSEIAKITVKDVGFNEMQESYEDDEEDGF